jgi:hypothetical protein
MGLADLFSQYAGIDPRNVPPEQAERDFDAICPECQHGTMSESVTDAFRSDRTPPFPDMLSRSFGEADPNQRASILNQVLSGLGPMVASGALGGLLQQVLGNRADDRSGSALPGAGASMPQVTPEQAARVDPRQVRDLAAEAERAQPGIVDRLGGFYAQNPALVKKLGGAALALIVANLATRGRR